MPKWLPLTLLCLLAALLLAWATVPWPDTPDGWIHLYRTQALAEALREGVWLPRWFPDFAFGYGYPVLHFYAPATYYPPALLIAMGVEPVWAMRIVLGLLYGLSGLGMGRLLLKFVGSAPALLGALTYLLFPYRLYDLFVRGAIPEFAAFLWLPFLINSAYQLCRHATPPRRAYVAPALLWTGLILTHNLTALMAAITLLFVWPWAAAFVAASTGADHLMRRWGQALWSVGWRLLTPLLLGALLSSWYWVPALLDARWVTIGASAGTAGFRNHFADWSTLTTAALTYPYPSAAQPSVPLPLWVLGLGVGAPLMLVLAWSRKVERNVMRLLLLSWLVAVFALLLTTATSDGLWMLTASVLGKLQFPWRWQTILAGAVALLTAASYHLLLAWLPNRPRWAVGATGLIALGIFVYSGVGLTGTPRLTNLPDLSTQAMWATDAGFGQVGATWTAEFLPIWVSEQRWAIGRAPAAPDEGTPNVPVAATVTTIATGYAGATYRTHADTAANLIFHQFYFPAWQVLVDDKPVPTAPFGNLGLLSFSLPAGDHILALRFGVTTAMWIGRLLTALGWLALLWSLLERRRIYHWRVGSWLLTGLLMLIVAGNRDGLKAQRNIVHLDYGTVQLTGAEVRPAHVGATATIRLQWLMASTPPSLTAFVHLVDAEGRVVAQYDAPIGGAYTPVERWYPGLLLRTDYPVTLPATLAPGDYQLLVGLYPAGQPEAPLVANGETEPRAAVGSLEVRP